MMKLITIISNLFVWLAFCGLLVLGYKYDAQTFFDQHTWSGFVMGLLTFTPTNAATLAVIVAYVGAMLNAENYTYAEQWRTAIKKGLFWFGAVFVGYGWIDIAKFMHGDPESYTKIAVAVLVACGVTGFGTKNLKEML